MNLSINYLKSKTFLSKNKIKFQKIKQFRIPLGNKVYLAVQLKIQQPLRLMKITKEIFPNPPSEIEEDQGKL